ncbi:unnamed protein product [Linum tenue]|uniref:Stress response NST1-like protein n=1 Tax=Linum tenue TaxID=586396 RepID=A0AAV0MK59_9ROSI|nr:unnamed protein product [Linum tenue]
MEATAINGRPASPEPDPDSELFYPEDFDSTCSTPFVSAPSSPGRNGGGGGGFFYSCPASPMHFAITSAAAHRRSSYDDDDDFDGGGCEFEFSARFGSVGPGHTGSMSSADELFLNGQIRPMKLSTHLEKPQVLAPLLDLDEGEEEGEEAELGGNKKGFHGESRGRDLRLRNKSLRRRTRSMSPLRSSSFEFADDDGGGEGETRKKKTGEGEEEGEEAVDEPNSMSASSSSTSRSSSAGRNSKRWVFLKEFLYRSKSEGRSNTKFWSNISFSPSKEKKGNSRSNSSSSSSRGREKGISNEGSSEKVGGSNSNNGGSGKKPVNGLGKKRVPAASPHELHYKASRAQAEEMRKRTFLPYRQGLLGCLGFSSKGYGAMNGFARALNPVSSR